MGDRLSPILAGLLAVVLGCTPQGVAILPDLTGAGAVLVALTDPSCGAREGCARVQVIALDPQRLRPAAIPAAADLALTVLLYSASLPELGLAPGALVPIGGPLAFPADRGGDLPAG